MIYNFFVISYKGESFTEVKKSVKNLGAWLNHFDNQILLCSQQEIGAIKSAIEANMNIGKDTLLIIEVDIKSVKGWLSKPHWEWIKNQRAKLKNNK